MKILRYFTECKMLSTDENGDTVSSTALCEVETPWSEANEEIAKREAHNGEYTIEDDGAEEVVEPTPEERIAELEEALALLLSGVTE